MISVSSPIKRTPRVMQLEGMFDLEPVDQSTVEIPYNIPDLNERDWNIGLIVGPSGSGKSTIANELFGSLVDPELNWPKDGSVVDAFPSQMGMKDITQLLSSVGFSSPPAWLRPYHVLSNGEKFRVTMARLLSEHPELVVVDEFTSVVDRTVAKIGSAAIARTVRKSKQKFVAVSCHYDIEEWLQPDWIYQPDTGLFLWRSVQPRPDIDMEVIRSDASAWRIFGPHHYLNKSVNRSARMYVGLVEGNAAAFVAVLPLMHPKVKKGFRLSRTVVLPDYQGIGIGEKLSTEIAANYKSMGRQMTSTLAHPALIKARQHSPYWACTRGPSRTALSRTDFQRQSRATGRLTVSFKYVGPAKDTLLGVVV